VSCSYLKANCFSDGGRTVRASDHGKRGLPECLQQRYPHAHPYNSISGTGERVGERLANDLGVTDGPDALKKLRSIPGDEIPKTWSQDRRVHFGAVVDGWVVPEQPAKILAEGREIHVLSWSAAMPMKRRCLATETRKPSMNIRSIYWGTPASTPIRNEVYAAESDADVPARYLQLQDDSFAYGAYSMARAMTRVGQEGYLYDFSYVETGMRASLGA
jgi:carboxylesterase type B